jgi:hypothetical protein
MKRFVSSVKSSSRTRLRRRLLLRPGGRKTTAPAALEYLCKLSLLLRIFLSPIIRLLRLSPSFHFLSPTFSPAIRGRTGVVIMTQKCCSLGGSKYRKVLSQSGVKVVRKSDIFTPAGRPTDVDFERAVFGKIAGLDKCRRQESSIAFQNARHPLKAIVIAGIQTAQEEPYCNRKYVKSLKFSKCWARGLLGRQVQQKQQQQQSEKNS